MKKSKERIGNEINVKSICVNTLSEEKDLKSSIDDDKNLLFFFAFLFVSFFPKLNFPFIKSNRIILIDTENV